MGRWQVVLHTHWNFLRFSALNWESWRLRFIFDQLLLLFLKIAISMSARFLNRRLFELGKNKSFCHYGSFWRLTDRKDWLSILRVIKALQVLVWSKRRIWWIYWPSIRVGRCLGMSDDIDSSSNRSNSSTWIAWITDINYYTTSFSLRCAGFVYFANWWTITISEILCWFITKRLLVWSNKGLLSDLNFIVISAYVFDYTCIAVLPRFKFVKYKRNGLYWRMFTILLLEKLIKSLIRPWQNKFYWVLRLIFLALDNAVLAIILICWRVISTISCTLFINATGLKGTNSDCGRACGRIFVL